MENPTRRKIRGVIQEIMKQKIEDGQLDESALTQGDLHKIRDSFDVSLLGLVGHRIRYPDREDRPIPRAPRESRVREPGAGRPARPPSATASPSADGASSVSPELGDRSGDDR
jgi:hypothetical protein